jgi:molybdate transport system substrate-binding protein
MATIRLLSAGAAQAVSERIIQDFERDTGHRVLADFGAVGAMKARMTEGEAVDAITLTQTMIDELVTSGWVVHGSRRDLGRVGTGVAVRAGTQVPGISHAAALKACIARAQHIVCPDPAIATAGKVVMNLLEKLEVLEEVRGQLRFFPNGYAAMRWLAAEGGETDLGITQDTEILPNKGVVYAGALPPEFQMKTVYSIGLASRAAEPQLAQDLIARFAAPGARTLLQEAGYELLQQD